MVVHLSVLGPLRAEVDGSPVHLGGQRRADLLAALALAGPVGISVERLADAMWGANPPATATRTLRSHVAHLRAALLDPRCIETVPGGYRLGSDVVSDAEEFVTDLREARRLRGAGDPHAALELFTRALGRWRGEPFADVHLAIDDLTVERRRLASLLLEGQSERMALELAVGRHREVVDQLQRLVDLNPHDETLVSLLATAFYRCDRQVEALEVLGALRTSLREVLGLDPGARIRELETAILRQDPSLRPDPALPRSTAGNLPVHLTRFVGRRLELMEVAELLERHRLVTLTGPGGIGKTRLAHATADLVAERFPQGVWVAELDGTVDEMRVPHTVARVLGVTEVQGIPIDVVVGRELARGERLLVLDTCEHLDERLGTTLARWLETAPGLRIIATSRRRLHVPGEKVWPVPPMRCATDVDGEVGSDAAELFVERATSVDPDLLIDVGVAKDIVRLCRRCEGNPLAIELAASRSGVLTPREIADRLDDQLTFLRDGPNSVADRHRSVEAAIRWSYDLLEPDARRLLRTLSVFSGAATLPSIGAICGGEDVTSILFSLVDHSLVSRVRIGDVSRYALLDSVRQFGLEQLRAADEEDEARQYHLAYHVSSVERLVSEESGDRALDLLEADVADVYDALDWAIAERHTDDAVRLVEALYHFWEMRHRSDGAHWTALVIDVLDDGPARARLLGNAAVFAWFAASTSEAVDLAKESLRRCDAWDVPPPVGALTVLSLIECWDGDPQAAASYGRRALEAAIASGNILDIHHARFTLAYALTEDRQSKAAIEHGEEALRVARDIGNVSRTINSLQALAYAWRASNPERAITLAEEAVDLSRRSGGDWDLIWSLLGLGFAELICGRKHEGTATMADVARLAYAFGDPRGLPASVEAIAGVAARTGRCEAAVALFAGAAAVRAVSGRHGSGRERAYLEREISSLRARVGESDFERNWSSAYGMSTEALVDRATSEAAALTDPASGGSGDQVTAS